MSMIGFDLIIDNELLKFKDYLKFGDLAKLDEEKNSLLGKAVSLVRFEFVSILLEQFDVNHQNVQGDTVMHLAIKTKSIEMIKLIKRYDYDSLIKNKSKRNVIEEAIYLGEYNIFKLLYDFKPNVNHLIMATKYFNNKIFKIVYETNKKFINCTDETGSTLLHIACSINSSNLVDFLLNKHIKFYLKNNEKETAMFNAVKYSEVNIIKKLMEYLPLDSENIFNEDIFRYASCDKYFLFEKQKEKFIFAVINENKNEIKDLYKTATEKDLELAKKILLDYHNEDLLEYINSLE